MKTKIGSRSRMALWSAAEINIFHLPYCDYTFKSNSHLQRISKSFRFIWDEVGTVMYCEENLYFFTLSIPIRFHSRITTNMSYDAFGYRCFYFQVFSISTKPFKFMFYSFLNHSNIFFIYFLQIIWLKISFTKYTCGSKN